MAITVLFTPSSLTASQYDETIKQLGNAGAATPQGRLYHACFGAESSLRVMEVWASQEAFVAFGQTLIPILQRVGIDPGQPEISEVYNTIQG
jgi:hypothetical protein